MTPRSYSRAIQTALDPDGLVFVHGELWKARAAGEPIPAGESVRVQGIEDGLVLVVEREREHVATA